MRVMTWNVHGLPSPLRLGGARSYRHMVELLAAEPLDVLVLQEAFVSAAKGIPAIARYENVVFGAGASLPIHLLGSGLVLASHHDLSDTSRMSFGWRRCVGVDCLANKGVLTARVHMPETHVDVFTLHLNKHRYPHELPKQARSEIFEQIALLRRYVEDSRNATIPAIIAGDFNFDRLDAALYAAWTDGWSIADVREAQETGPHIPFFDHQFILPGSAWRLWPVCVSRKFADCRLSDHAALVVDYDLAQAS